MIGKAVKGGRAVSAIMEQARLFIKGITEGNARRTPELPREMLEYDVTDEACEQMRQSVAPSLVGKKLESVNPGVRRARR